VTGFLHNEIEFDQVLSPPQFYTFYCNDCYIKQIAPAILRSCDQENRVKYVLNQPHYWGVLEPFDGYQIAEKFINDEIWWEFRSANPIHNGELVLAIHNKRNAFTCSREFLNKYDRHTSFIKSMKTYDGEYKYYISHKLNSFLNDVKDNCLDFYCSGIPLFNSLGDAIVFVQFIHNSEFHKGALRELCESYPAVCVCSKISRFSFKKRLRDKNTDKTVNDVWSLQELTAFFIKQYSIHNKAAINRLNHRYCMNNILSTDAVSRQLLKSGKCTCALNTCEAYKGYTKKKHQL
jgi:hypothetical protein